MDKNTPQKNKILNYFSRIPRSDESPKNVETVNDDNQKGETRKIKNRKLSTSESLRFALHDIVLAKLNGRRWGCMICEDHHKKYHIENSKYHVQFFDDKHTHGWIPNKNITYFSQFNKMASLSEIEDKKLRKAYETALKGLDMELGERIKLLDGDDDDFDVDIYSGDKSENSASTGVSETEPKIASKSNDDSPVRKRKLDNDSSPENNKETPAKRVRIGGKSFAQISIHTPSTSAAGSAPVASTSFSNK